MTPVYKTTDALLSDYNSLPEIEQNRVGKYLKNLVRIHKSIASLNFADRQVNWELSKESSLTPKLKKSNAASVASPVMKLRR